MLDLEPYKFDKHINKHLGKIVYLFQDVHPNAVTIFGMVMNGFMFHYYFVLDIKYMTCILLVIRIICDNLDGMIARKFNKVTKLGGLLDSLSDCFLLSTVWYGALIYFKIPYSECVAILFGCIMFWYLLYHDALFLHKNFSHDKSLLNKIPILISENTYLSALLISTVMYLT